MSQKLNEHESLIAEFLTKSKTPISLRGVDGGMDGNRSIQERVTLLRETKSVLGESKQQKSCTWTGWGD